MPAYRRIVMTGGPGGGKSSLIRELRAEDPHAERWLEVPEAASLLMSAGLVAGQKPFQIAVVHLQMALEENIMEGAGGRGSPERVLLCDRGTVDSFSYWRLAGWDEQEFFDVTQMSYEKHLRRYDGVIHMQTTAIGTESAYKSGPDTPRLEPPSEAIEIDAQCARAWQGHERWALIENAGRDWQAKSQAAREVLSRWVSGAADA